MSITRTYNKEFEQGGKVRLELEYDEVDMPVLDKDSQPVEENGKPKTERRDIFKGTATWVVDPVHNILTPYQDFKESSCKDFFTRIKKEAPVGFSKKI
jgi:hypothetical protein